MRKGNGGRTTVDLTKKGLYYTTAPAMPEKAGAAKLSRTKKPTNTYDRADGSIREGCQREVVRSPSPEWMQRGMFAGPFEKEEEGSWGFEIW